MRGQSRRWGRLDIARIRAGVIPAGVILAGVVLGGPLVAQDPGSDSGSAAVAFERDVLPILQQRCYSCHAERDMQGKKRRIRGGLRVDGAEFLLRGGDGGRVLVPGKPTQSELYTRTVLPAEHDDIMPAKGEPLSAEQTALLKRWIAGGASFGGWAGAAAPELKKDSARAAARAPSVRERWFAAAEAASAELEPLAPGRLAELAGSDATVEPVVPGSSLVRVEFLGHEEAVDDARLRELIEALGPRLAHLGLARTGITDRGVRDLVGLPSLVWLDLRETSVGDAGASALATCAPLRHLNLVGTRVGDRGLAALADHSELAALYLWRSAATEAAVTELAKRRPELRVHGAPVLPAASKERAGGGRSGRRQARAPKSPSGDQPTADPGREKATERATRKRGKDF